MFKDDVESSELMMLIPSKWREKISEIGQIQGVTIEPGSDLINSAGRVVGSSIAAIVQEGRPKVLIIDQDTLDHEITEKSLRNALESDHEVRLVIAGESDSNLKDNILSMMKSAANQ